MILTPRVQLELLTLKRARMALVDRAALAEDLDAEVPEEWPNEDFRDVLPLLVQEWETTGGSDGWTWIVMSREPRIAIGSLGTKGGPDPKGAIEIGYGLVPSAWGKGLMTEAVQAMLGELRVCGIRRVIAETEPSNLASHRVLERCAFTRCAGPGGLWWWERVL